MPMKQLGKIEDRSLSDGVYLRLRNAILDAELPPGFVLTIDELAKELGLSITPIREALARLAIEGLVERTRNRQAVVACVRERDVRDIYEARAIMEPAVYALVADLVEVDPSAMKSLVQLGKTLEQSLALAPEELLSPSALRKVLNADGELRLLADKALGNELLARFINLLNLHARRVRKLAERAVLENSYAASTIRAIATEHLDIVNALLSGDARRIESSVKQHLDGSQRRTWNALQPIMNGD